MDRAFEIGDRGTALVPAVAGYTVGVLLGLGGHGEVWSATEIATGDTVAIKIGREVPEPDPEVAPRRHVGWRRGGRTAREVAVLSRIRHPHVVHVRAALELADGRVALVLDLAAGGNLASLVIARSALSPAEVSTILVPLAQALDHLHSRGLVHGDISPGNVLFSAEGRPLLADLGVSRVLGAGEDAEWGTPGFCDPAAADGADPRAVDVWQLGAVAWFALTGRPPAENRRVDLPAAPPPTLEAIVARCLDPAPEMRPRPAELASEAYAAVRPGPIRLLPRRESPEGSASRADPSGIPASLRAEAAEAGTAGDPRDDATAATRRVFGARPRREAGPVPTPAQRRAAAWWARVRRRTAAARAGTVAGVAGLAVLVLGLLAVPSVITGLSRPDPPRQGRSSTAIATAPGGLDGSEVPALLSALWRGRAEAFRTASADGLRRVDEPGSPAMAADRAVVAELRRQGLRLHGLRAEISDPRVVSASGPTADVVVMIRTSAHTRVAADGRAVTMVPAAPAKRVTLTLVQASPGWLVRSVR